MTIEEVIKSYKPFRRPHSDEVSQYFEGGTGPYGYFGCDYFIHSGVFSTSIDLYAEDIFADDWIVVE